MKISSSKNKNKKYQIDNMNGIFRLRPCSSNRKIEPLPKAMSVCIVLDQEIVTERSNFRLISA